MINNSEFVFIYIDPINGEKKEFTRRINDMTLKDLINYWTEEMASLNINYGNNNNGENLLYNLNVLNVYNDDNTISLNFNAEFKSFDTAMTHPEYYMFGLMDILKQVRFVKGYNILIENKSYELINPADIVLKKIKINDTEDN